MTEDSITHLFEDMCLMDRIVILVVMRFMQEENGTLTPEETHETALLIAFGCRAWGDEFDASLDEAMKFIDERRELRKQQSGGQADPRAAGVPAHKLPRLTGPLWEVY